MRLTVNVNQLVFTSTFWWPKRGVVEFRPSSHNVLKSGRKVRNRELIRSSALATLPKENRSC